MNLLVEQEVKGYRTTLPGLHSGNRFVVSLSRQGQTQTIASFSVFCVDDSAGRVELGRVQVTGDSAVMFDIKDSGSPVSFYLNVFDWIKLPLTLRVWSHDREEAEGVNYGGSSVGFHPVGDTVLAGDGLAVYVGDGEDFWTVGCRSVSPVKGEAIRFSCGSGRSVIGVSSQDFSEPRWWDIDHGWYIHNFEEIRAVDDKEIPEQARFSWSPLTKLGILIDGPAISYQVKRPQDKDFQTLYKTTRKSFLPLHPAAVLGPQSFIYNCIST